MTGWSPMQESDLASVVEIADVVHVDYPEDPRVFADRLACFPSGALMARDASGRAVGYALTHPWMFGAPPALNVELREIPREADTYYIHDVALLPETRGSGLGSSLMARVVETATALALPSISLVAVNNSGSFWKKHGFEVFDAAGALAEKLKSYDEDARYMVRNLR